MCVRYQLCASVPFCLVSRASHKRIPVLSRGLIFPESQCVALFSTTPIPNHYHTSFSFAKFVSWSITTFFLVLFYMTSLVPFGFSRTYGFNWYSPSRVANLQRLFFQFSSCIELDFPFFQKELSDKLPSRFVVHSLSVPS